MDLLLNPRAPVEAMIRQGDLRGLLEKAGELHGHFCPYVSLGVRAGVVALNALDVRENAGMEDVVAIVETNNCFSDGIQVVTGCTFANNALVYRDLGKTAVTLATRNGEAVRVAVRRAYAESFLDRYPDGRALFDKIVARREEPTSEERQRFRRLWAEISFDQLDLAAETVFTVSRQTIDVPAFAPIKASVTCAVCGEPVMETKARVHDGQPVCIACASASVYQLDGAGIGLGDAFSQ